MDGLDRENVRLELLKNALPSRSTEGAPRQGLDQDRGLEGRSVPLVGASGGDPMGVALRPLSAKNPIFISVGHRVGLQTALELVWSCCRYRIPEPTRQADIRSREFVRKH